MSQNRVGWLFAANNWEIDWAVGKPIYVLYRLRLDYSVTFDISGLLSRVNVKSKMDGLYIALAEHLQRTALQPIPGQLSKIPW